MNFWQTVGEAVGAFFADGRSQAILALVALDLVTGVMAALRTHTFDLARLGEFFGTNILPYCIGYLVVYIFGAVLGATLPPAVAAILQQIDQWAGAGLAILTLLGSIVQNLSVFRPVPPPTP